jgi:hypothetical protein
MAAPRARYQRQAAGALVNPADGSVLLENSEDEPGSAAEGGSSLLPQVAAGTLLSFLCASVSNVITGEGERSLLSLIGLVLGAALGSVATRPSAALESEAGAQRAAAATFVGAAVSAMLFYLLLPELAVDNAAGALASALGAFGAQGLGSPEGRARAELQLRTLSGQVAASLGAILRGSGKLGAGSGGPGAPDRPGVGGVDGAAHKRNDSLEAADATATKAAGGAEAVV